MDVKWKDAEMLIHNYREDPAWSDDGERIMLKPYEAVMLYMYNRSVGLKTRPTVTSGESHLFYAFFRNKDNAEFHIQSISQTF